VTVEGNDEYGMMSDELKANYSYFIPHLFVSIISL
jgi:hypothetical protein